MKVLLHYMPGPEWRRRVASFAEGGLEVACCAEDDDARFFALLPDIEVVWHLLRPIGAAEIAKAAKLRLIQKIGVGVNTIDLDAAAARGIAVCNLPGGNGQAVAEMTLLLMLACLRRLPLVDRALREGTGWALDPALQDSYGEIKGRTIGLVGMGGIPRLLLPVLEAMGARVIYTATAPKPDIAAEYRSLDDLLAEADVVSLHLPLTAETEGLIDEARIAAMKPGTVLINTARGALVDQGALAAALASGHLGAAGLDAFPVEPVDTNDPLLAMDNVVLTPHVAWLTGETFERSLTMAVENCRRLVAGEPLLNRVV